MAPDTKVMILNKEAFSVEKLMTAWAELKSNPGFVSSKELFYSLNNITPEWFRLSNNPRI